MLWLGFETLAEWREKHKRAGAPRWKEREGHHCGLAWSPMHTTVVEFVTAVVGAT